MCPIARVRPKNNILDINDNLINDDGLMLFDVMDGRSFFKKTPQSLTKHIFSIKSITRVCDTVFDDSINRSVAGLLKGDY
jgi:hypothetical protein